MISKEYGETEKQFPFPIFYDKIMKTNHTGGVLSWIRVRNILILQRRF